MNDAAGSAPGTKLIRATFGTKRTDTVWTDQREIVWSDLAKMLTTHTIGPKDGPCIVPAVFRGTERKKNDADAISAVFLDSDTGKFMVELADAIRRHGWGGVVHSTHSHLTPYTKVSRKHWQDFLKDHPEGTPTMYLIERKQMLPQIAAQAVIEKDNPNYVYFKHQPCPRYRVVVPLVQPWRSADYPSQDAANAGWSERIAAVAHALDLQHDQSCTDTSRLFYLPRCPPDGPPPESVIIDGKPVNLFSLPPCQGKQNGAGTRSIFGIPSRPAVEFIDPETGEVCNLVSWAAEYGHRFKIADALRSRKPEILTGKIADRVKVHIRCPNVDAHSDPGTDGATFVMDAGQGQTAKGFVAHCRHNHCTGLDRLVFVHLMLSKRWLAIADLTDETFLTNDDASEGDADEEEQAGEEPATPVPTGTTEPDGVIPKPLTKAERAALVERLADLDEDDYELEREPAAAQMSRGHRIKFRVTALDKLVEKIRQARADAEAARAAAAAAAALAARKAQPPGPPPPDTDEVMALIAEFNALYFVVNENGRAAIYAPKHDPDQNRRFYERIEFVDLDKLYLNRTMLTGTHDKTGEPIYERVATVWLHHHKRRQYIGGIVFDPSSRKHPDDVLNLWRDFAVTPTAGAWTLLKEHARIIVCNGNAEHFDYLMDWMADLVQHPEKQGEVAVVLRGAEGSGKGILARALKYLLGQHGFAISNAKHLTGNFNAHLRDCVFLFADEALYAGDKAHVGILKSIITEPYLTIEGKFQNAAMSVNRLHLMLASNELWVVPASLESRRFYVLDVSNARAKDHAYFAAIQAELETGGYAAMLHELLNHKIVSNLRSPPVTDALIAQRTLSLDTTAAWWLDCLLRGYVFASEFGLEDVFAQWLDPISTELLYASYLKFCAAKRDRHALNRVHFGRWMQENTGGKPHRPGIGKTDIVGEHITDATTTDSKHSSRVADPVYADRPTGYSLGTLDESRAAFTTATKLTVPWDQTPT